MKNKIKKGFTLIEMLAVIAIISLIVVFTTPSVLKVYKDSKKKSFESEMKNLVRIAEVGFGNTSLDTLYVTDTTYEFINGEETVIGNISIDISGDKPQNGVLTITKDGEISFTLYEDNYCAVKEADSKEITITESTLENCITSFVTFKEFKKHYGGADYDYFYGVIPISDGYIAVGFSRSTDEDLEDVERKGAQDAIIVKYDFYGNVVWKKNFGGTADDLFNKVIQVSDGYVAVGRSYSDDGDLLNLHYGPTSGTDCIIVKFDTNGNVVWKKNFGGTSYEEFYGVIQVSDGYIAVGNSHSNDIDILNLNNGANDGIVVKYDTNGNMVWIKNFGGTENDNFYQVAGSSDGFVAIGTSHSNDIDLLNLHNGSTFHSDGIIVKYDTNGNVVWKKNFGGTSGEYFRGGTSVSDGYIAVGYSYSTDGDLLNLHYGTTSYNDAIIVKYDVNGNIVWKKIYGGTTYDEFYDITPVQNGYITVGYSNSSDVDLADVEVKGSSDGTIVKYNTSGNIVWKKNFGGTRGDNFINVTSLPGGYAVVGYSASNDIDLLNLHYGTTDYHKDAIIVTGKDN